MTGQTKVLMKQLAIALMGQALPNTSVLSAIVDDLRKGIFAMIVAGTLVTALIVLCCFGFYTFLVMEGLSKMGAIGITALILLMVSIISFMQAQKYLARTSEAKNKLGFFPEEKDAAGTFEAVATSFIEGFLSEEKPLERKVVRRTSTVFDQDSYVYETIDDQDEPVTFEDIHSPYSDTIRH